MELVTTGPSQEVKLLWEDDSNLRVPPPHPDTATKWTHTAIPVVSVVPIVVVANQFQHSLPVSLIILLHTELQATPH